MYGLEHKVFSFPPRYEKEAYSMRLATYLSSDRPQNGQNSRIFIFSRRDFIFTQYVPFYVRNSSSKKTSDFGPLPGDPGPQMVQILKILFLVVETSYLHS